MKVHLRVVVHGIMHYEAHMGELIQEDVGKEASTKLLQQRINRWIWKSKISLLIYLTK